MPGSDGRSLTELRGSRHGSFSQAAEENGLSRILIGFHFRKAVEAGIEHGRRIGNRAVSRFLRPVHGHWDWSWSDDDEAPE